MANQQSGNPGWIRSNWITILLTIIPLIVTALSWSSIPKEIPVHWNQKGDIDGYGPRAG